MSLALCVWNVAGAFYKDAILLTIFKGNGRRAGCPYRTSIACAVWRRWREDVVAGFIVMHSKSF